MHAPKLLEAGPAHPRCAGRLRGHRHKGGWPRCFARHIRISWPLQCWSRSPPNTTARRFPARRRAQHCFPCDACHPPLARPRTRRPLHTRRSLRPGRHQPRLQARRPTAMRVQRRPPRESPNVIRAMKGPTSLLTAVQYYCVQFYSTFPPGQPRKSGRCRESLGTGSCKARG